jgi:membrane associated rhomboid family serine protease
MGITCEPAILSPEKLFGWAHAPPRTRSPTAASSLLIVNVVIYDLMARASDYPITISVFTVLTVVFVVEYAVIVNYPVQVFEYWFITQFKLTPGVILGPVSHGTLPHFLFNMAMFCVFSFLLEQHFDRRTYAVILLLTAYLPTYVHTIISHVTTGDTGTLGFSGAVYGIVPLYAVIAAFTLIRHWDGGISFNIKPEDIVLYVGMIFVALLIPFDIGGYVDLISTGHQSATYTHLGGFVLGLLCGIYIQLEP